MTTAAQILSRARAQQRAYTPQTAQKVHITPMSAPTSGQMSAPVAQMQNEPQIMVHPPEIPPMVPLPKPRSAIYKELMHKHDRMGTRHLPK